MISNDNTRVGYLAKAPGAMSEALLGVIMLGKPTTRRLIMNRITTCTVTMALALGGLTACAVDKPSKQAVADQDAGKLSKDGSTAIRDVSLARLAIFNGQPAQAKDIYQRSTNGP